MSQHERQRLWRSECVDCFDEHVSVDKTHDEAMTEMLSDGWVEDDIGWHCAECRPPTPNDMTAPDLVKATG